MLLLAQADLSCHAALSRSIALRVVIIFRMTATTMTLYLFAERKIDGENGQDSASNG